MRPAMRSVSGTLLNPDQVFRAMGHMTECISTNIRLAFPRPNHSRASGSSAIAGSGLSIAVNVLSRSRPNCVVTARALAISASALPARYPFSRVLSELTIFSGSSPLRRSSLNACSV